MSKVPAITENDKKHPPTLQKLVKAAHSDPECRQSLKILNKPRCDVPMEIESLLVCTKLLNEKVQIYVTAICGPVVLYPFHYSTMIDHPSVRHLYGTMQTQCYGPHMVDDVYGTEKEFKSCAPNR